ncbi:MAG TPA: hypothetical protein VGD74_04570 [Vulgatibacter sp.]
MTTTPAIAASLGELLPRHLFLEPLLAGARVLELGALEIAGGVSATALHDRGAASVVSLADDASVVETARRVHGGPGLRFDGGALGSLAAASFDLVVIHDPRWLEELDELSRVLAPGGRLAAAATGHGAYRETASALTSRFPVVEVATIRAVQGWAVAPVQVPGTALSVEELADEPEAAERFLFVGGSSPTGIATQRLVVLPPGASVLGTPAKHDRVEELQGEGEELRARSDLLRAENDALRTRADELRAEIDALRTRADEVRAENDALRARSDELREENDALRTRADELRAENDALRETVREADGRGDELAALEAEAARARASAKELRDELASLHAGGAPDFPFERLGGWGPADEALERRARAAEERAELAILRAKEAEESMRAAQRRAERAEGERADALVAARRIQLDAERIGREAGRPIPSWPPRRG